MGRLHEVHAPPPLSHPPGNRIPRKIKLDLNYRIPSNKIELSILYKVMGHWAYVYMHLLQYIQKKSLVNVSLYLLIKKSQQCCRRSDMADLQIVASDKPSEIVARCVGSDGLHFFLLLAAFAPRL